MNTRVVLVLAAFCSVCGFAAEIVWNGAVDSSFANGGNWEGGIAPGIADTAVFRGSPTVQPVIPATTEYEIASIRFETGGWVLSGANTSSRLKFGVGSGSSVLRVRVEAGTVDFTVPVRHIRNGPTQVWEVVTGAYLKTAGIHDASTITLQMGTSSATAGTLELGGTVDNDGLYPQVMYGTLILNKGGGSASACGNVYVGPNGTLKYGAIRTTRNPGQVYRFAVVDGTLDLNGDGVNSPLNNWRLQGLRGSGRVINTGTGYGVLYLNCSDSQLNGNGTFSGTIDDAGTQPIRVQISGAVFNPRLEFTGTNTYAGPTSFGGGYTGKLYNAQTFGYTNSSIFFNDNSVLNLNGQVCDRVFTNNTGNTGPIFINTSAQTAVMRGFFSMPDGSKYVSIGGANDLGDIAITNAMVVKNGCKIVKRGPRTLTLAGADDNDGLRMSVEGGRVVLAKNGMRACGGDDNGGVEIYNGSEVEMIGPDTDQIWAGTRVIVDNGAFSINNDTEEVASFTLGNTTTTGLIRGGKLYLIGKTAGGAPVTVYTYLVRGQVDSILEKSGSYSPWMYKISTNEVVLNSGVRLNGGNIVVSNGLLRINGAVASDTPVSVLTDGTLAGSGVISNSVALSGSAKLRFDLGATPAQTAKLRVIGSVTAETWNASSLTVGLPVLPALGRYILAEAASFPAGFGTPTQTTVQGRTVKVFATDSQIIADVYSGTKIILY